VFGISFAAIFILFLIVTIRLYFKRQW